MSNISLSAGVRQNLLALQSTADLMSLTQNRLATGKKVNTALDNPNSFFTAAGLDNRSGDLSNLLDSMGQAVQTLKAADEGISSISKLVDAAKAKANQALNTTNSGDRDKFATEFNDLLGQIEDIAKDSGYNGKNLLAGSTNNLSVNFNETGTSKLAINAVDYTNAATGLGVSDVTAATNGAGSFTFTGQTADTLVLDTSSGGAFQDGDVINVTSGSTTVASLTLTATTTAADLVSFLDGVDGISANFTNDGTDGTINITSTADFTIANDGAGGGTAADVTLDYTGGGWSSDTGISASVTQLNSALNTLRAQSSSFGTNLTVVQNRQDFTKSLVNTLREGSGMLTLADTNEEGANLLALQTRQQLSTTALSMAAQSDQNVLRLF